MSRARNFLSHSKGVSAVEFALILPLLLVLYLGGIEVSQAVSINRKTTLVARTVSDLVAQGGDSFTAAELENIFAAAEAIMAPYPVNNTRITVSSVETDEDGASTVDWSRQKNGTARGKGSPVSLPPGLASTPGFLIMAEVRYLYRPSLGYTLIGDLNLEETVYMRPRLVTQIAEPAS